MGDNMEKNIKDFAKFFAENDEKLIQDMEKTYLSTLIKSITVMNTTLIMALLYKGLFKENDKDLYSFIFGYLNNVHETIINAMIDGISSTEDDELFALLGSEENEIIKKIKTRLDKCFEETKSSFFDDFKKTCQVISALDTKGKAPKEKTDDSKRNI